MSTFATSVGRISGAVGGTDRAGDRERRKKREEPTPKNETVAARDEAEFEGEPVVDETPSEGTPRPPSEVRGVYGRGGEARGRGTGSLDIRA